MTASAAGGSVTRKQAAQVWLLTCRRAGTSTVADQRVLLYYITAPGHCGPWNRVALAAWAHEAFVANLPAALLRRAAPLFRSPLLNIHAKLAFQAVLRTVVRKSSLLLSQGDMKHELARPHRP